MVTQADRIIAAEIVRYGAPGVGNGNKVISDEIRGGLHDGYMIVQAIASLREQSTAQLEADRADLLLALKALFESYKDLADSGDCGFWSLEDQPVGKQALATIARIEGDRS